MLPADAEPALPLGDDEIATLLEPFAGAKQIALAVSGGADSLGMLAAVARWRHASLSVDVLTVDHRLQPGSRKVAAAVAAAAARFGFEARVLVRTGAAPVSDIEGRARAARYRLLLSACRETSATHLLIAHQQDDLAEGFLLRLKRGAGIFGLAAMRAEIDVGGVTLARPFLSVPHRRLRATALAAGLAPVDDPMNADPRFARTRARELVSLFGSLGLGAATLASAAERMAEAADAIDHVASAFLALDVATDAFAIARFDVAGFAELPHAVRLRVLTRLVIAVGGEDYAPRGERLLALHDAILGSPGRFKRTVGGTVVEGGGGRVATYREAGRDGLPSVPLRPGDKGMWDHRYDFEVARNAPRGLVLAAAGASASRRDGVPRAALAVAPAVFLRGKPLDPSPTGEGFPANTRGFVTLRCILRARLDRPPLFPDFERG